MDPRDLLASLPIPRDDLDSLALQVSRDISLSQTRWIAVGGSVFLLSTFFPDPNVRAVGLSVGLVVLLRIYLWPAGRAQGALLKALLKHREGDRVSATKLLEKAVFWDLRAGAAWAFLREYRYGDGDWKGALNAAVEAERWLGPYLQNQLQAAVSALYLEHTAEARESLARLKGASDSYLALIALLALMADDEEGMSSVTLHERAAEVIRLVEETNRPIVDAAKALME